MISSLLMMVLAPVALAADPSDRLLGLWTSPSSGNVIEFRRRASSGPVEGVLVGVTNEDAARGYRYDESVIRDVSVTTGGVGFRLTIRPGEADLASVCEPLRARFLGRLLADGTLDGERQRASFSASEDRMRCSGALDEGAWIEYRLARRNPPACCARMDFACASLQARRHGLDPASPTREAELRVLRAECEDAQTESRHRCQSRLPFRESFDEFSQWGDSGEGKLRVLVLELYDRPVLAVGGERTAAGWEFKASVRHEDESGAGYFVFEPKPDGSQAPLPFNRELADVVAVFSLEDQFFTTLGTRVWLTREDLARAYLADKFSRMADDCMNVARLAAADPVGWATLSGFFENIGPPEVRDTLASLGQSYDVMVDSASPRSARLLSAVAVIGVPLGEIFGGGRSLREILSEGAERAAARGRLLRQRIQEMQSRLSHPNPEVRAMAEAEIARLRRGRDLADRSLESLRDAQDYAGDRGVQATRELLLEDMSDADLLRFAASLAPGNRHAKGVSEIIGMRAVRRTHGGRRAPGFARPFHQQRHGPDTGFDSVSPPSEAFREGDLDVLVEAKSRRGATAATRPEQVLGEISSLPGRPRQHSPEHIQGFARGRVNSTDQERRRVEVILAQRLAEGHAETEVGVSAIRARLRDLEEHAAYWRRISERARTGQGLRRDVVITDPVSGNFFVWTWDDVLGSYQPRSRGKLIP